MNRVYGRQIVKKTNIAGTVPTINVSSTTDIYDGEFFLNTVDKRLWVRSDDEIIEITAPEYAGGNDTEVQFNDAATFAGDSTFTFNKTTKAVNVKSLSINTNSSLNKQDDLFSIENQIEVPAGVGGAVAFATNTDVITIPHSASLNIAGSSISIEFWMYNNSVYGSALQKWGAYRVSFFGNLRFVLDGVGTVEVIHPTNQWVHVVCVYNGSNMYVYFNGSVAATVAATGNITTNTANVLLGAAYANAFNGTLDEVRIYSIALTPAEISTHYNSGNGNYGTAETNLVAGWHLDESSGTAIVDYSGNNNNGVLTGCNWVAGKVNVPGTRESVSILDHGNSTRSNSRGNINFARDNNTWVKLGDGEPQCKLDVAGDCRFGSASDYTQFEADGTRVAVGTATTYRDELNDLVGKKLESPASEITADYVEAAVRFSNNCTLDDFVFMNIQINHDWLIGTPIAPHLHWIQEEEFTPNWLIEYRWQINGETKHTIWKYLPWNNNIFSWTSGSLNQITTFSAIDPPTGAGLSDILQIKLYRDCPVDSGQFGDVDQYTADVLAYSFDIHIECDMDGSHSEYTK